MFLTIEEMRQQIKFAKVQLIESAKIWVNSLRYIDDCFVADDWFLALQVQNSDGMEEKLRECGVPLVKRAELMRLSFNPQDPFGELSASSSSTLIQLTEFNVLKYYYNSCVTDSSLVGQFATLTTLMEQLHQLDNLLSAFEPCVDFKSIHLVHEMARSIQSEWCFVKTSQDTVACYTARLQATKTEFDHATQFNTQAFEQFEQQFNIRLVQFQMTLCSLAQYVVGSFFLVPDNRYVFIRLFRAYLPWQAMIHNLGLSVFGKDAVFYPDNNSLDINSERLGDMAALWSREFNQSALLLREQYAKITHEIEVKIKRIERNLDAMDSVLHAQQEMSEQRHAALSTLPTQVPLLYGFFQNIQATYGHDQLHQLLSEQSDRERRIIDVEGAMRSTME